MQCKGILFYLFASFLFFFFLATAQIKRSAGAGFKTAVKYNIINKQKIYYTGVLPWVGLEPTTSEFEGTSSITEPKWDILIHIFGKGRVCVCVRACVHVRALKWFRVLRNPVKETNIDDD